MQSQDAANPCKPFFCLILCLIYGKKLIGKRSAARAGACGRGAARGQVSLLVIRYIKGKSTIFEHKAWEVCRLSFSKGYRWRLSSR